MSEDPVTTIVIPDDAPAAPTTGLGAALARLAFGSVPSSVAGHSLGPRHLAFLPPESLELDLDDPNQRQFGDYELIEKLGQGGMGVVYRARQRSLDREVAIKLLSAGPWASADFIERFQREAQSAARMQHPNIVAIYEIDAHDELNFFAMRLVQGESLAHRLQESGPLPSRLAAQLMRTIAEALDYAHRLGVLHLDLKPANVLIDERGEPQVADFGLARRLDETLTHDNDEVSGTPSYMAPEQAQIKSHKLSQATDIYGLGAILYELLTGRPPFLGSTTQDTLQRVITETPTPLRQLQAAIPLDLEAICLKCLAKEPAERYPSARALAEDLGRFLEARPVSARPLNAFQRTARWARREPRFAGAVAFAALALGVGLVVSGSQWRRAELNAASARATAWSQRLDAMWQDYVRGDWVAALPRLVQNLREQEASGAAREAESERRRLGILWAASPRLIDVIPLGQPLMAVAISDDGTRLAALTRLARGARGSIELHMIDAARGTVLWRTPLEQDIQTARFSPDGRTLVVAAFQSRERELQSGTDVGVRLDAATGAPMPLPAEFSQAPFMRFSHDASVALVATGGHVRSYRTDTWQALGFDREYTPGTRLRLSSDGGIVVYAGNGRRRVEFHLSDGTRRASYELPAPELAAEVSLSPDGRWLALATDTGSMVLIDGTSGREQLSAPRCDGDAWFPTFSRDSSWLSGTCLGARTRIWETREARMLPATIEHRDMASYVVVDATHRMVLAQERGRTRMYRLQDVSEDLQTIVPTPLLNSQAERTYWASTFNLAHGLLAFGTSDGRVKLSRLPRSPVLPGSAAPLIEPDLDFDGRHVVTVEGNVARVVAAPEGTAAGPALTHSAPVERAFLTAGGATAVTVSGRELRAWDWRTGALRIPPLMLAGTPVRVAPSPDGERLLTSVLEYADGRCRERLQLWDARDGAPLGESLLPGPLFGLRYSADGTRVLAWRGERLTLLDGRRLGDALLAVSARDATGPVLLVDARMNGSDEIHAATRRRNINFIAYYWRWDGRTGALLEQLPVDGQAHGLALSPSGALAMSGMDLMAPRPTQRDRAGASLEFLPFVSGASLTRALAYSRDGRWLAESPRHGSIVVDAATRIALSPPLIAPVSTGDVVEHLAFDPGSNALLARTEQGSWLYWSLAPDARPLEEIERERTLYAPEVKADFGEPVSSIDPELRDLLRRRDPGAPPAPTGHDSGLRTLTLPARAPDTPDALLDLGAHYTPVSRHWEPIDTRSLPSGRHRLLGVDFDLRGIIHLAGEEAAPIMRTYPERVDGIALPRFASGLDLLLGEAGFTDALRPVLDAVLHYRDGGELRQTLSLRIDPRGFDVLLDQRGEDIPSRGGRIAWLARWQHHTHELRAPLPIFVVYVDNPEPTRELASLSLVARSAPYVLAISADVPPAPGH